jgi:hypothetical protein
MEYFFSFLYVLLLQVTFCNLQVRGFKLQANYSNLLVRFYNLQVN